MADLTRTFDWGQTSVGPIDRWPEVLVNAVNTLLNSRHPMFLWWGEDLVQFYNDAYRPSLGGGKHPIALGQKGKDCWPEIWPIILPQIEAVMTKGEASWHENQLVPIIRKWPAGGGLLDLWVQPGLHLGRENRRYPGGLHRDNQYRFGKAPAAARDGTDCRTVRAGASVLRIARRA